MDTNVFGKAFSIIGSSISAIWGIRYLHFLSFFLKTGYPRTGNGYEPGYFNNMRAYEVAQKESTSLTIFLVGLGILALGLLLIYLSREKNESNDGK